MTEQEWIEGLRQPVELPAVVEERMKQACAQAAGTGRRSRRGLRTALAVAGLAAALCAGAAAGYTAVRGETLPDLAAVLDGLFGNGGRPGVEAQTAYDQQGRMVLNLPNQERVEVDVDQAEALVGDYLPEKGYVWQIGTYTLTVESYLLDEHSGAARLSLMLERPGGVEGLQVAPEDGEVWSDGSGVGLNICALSADGEWTPMGMRLYADRSRSTEEALCLTAAMAGGEGWRAEDGLRIRFLDLSRNRNSDKDISLVATLELPGLDSLPAVETADGAPGEICVSAIGLRLAMTEADYVALEYDDGTHYVVRDAGANLQNTEYALSWGSGSEGRLCLCFNRLVEPGRVTGVTVDGQYYALKQ